jgi:drug/metabolite transporter (DMT)-like permease
MQDMRPRIFAHLALVFTVLFWGMSFVSTKMVLNAGFPPVTIALIRFTIAGCILFPLQKLLEPSKKFKPRTALDMTLGGLTGVTLYFFCENNGIMRTTASNAALIIATIPVFTLIAERLFFSHRMRLYQAGGILFSILGVYFLVNPGGTTVSDTGNLHGNLFMLAACLSWVSYIIINKKLHVHYSGLAMSTYHSLFGALFLIPLALLERNEWVRIDMFMWMHILYLSIICSAAAYVLYLFALSRLEPTVVSSYINLIPVTGAVGGVSILGDRLLPVQIIGAFAVIIGVVFVNLRFPLRA